MRRLPVYFLLDCSESMIGPAVNAVQSGVEMLIGELRRDPQALETAHISLITFDRDARQIMPLTELTEVQVPKLRVGPGTSLGAGLKKLRECVQRECRRTTSEQKGDFRPIAFLLTDGQPTDEWESAAQALRDSGGMRLANLYAIGCGDDVDFDLLGRVSDIVFRLDEMTPDKMSKLFVWLSASVQSASIAAGSGNLADTLDLTKLPKEVTKVEPGEYSRPSGPPRQIFVAAKCSKTAQGYIMRYAFDPARECYAPTASHALDEEHGPGGLSLPPLSASQLDGVPPCCHCESPLAGACGCGGVMCLPFPVPESVTCPSCKQRITLDPGSSGDFDVRQSQG
jgi:uncharacterized protein YegL